MSEMRFIKPIDGDCLTNVAGKYSAEKNTLTVTVRVAAPAGKRITICDVPAGYVDGEYRAKVKLDGYRNTLQVLDAESGEKVTAVVYWLPKATGGFRFSVDDNIWFLQDITANKDTYTSIFDNPYLGLYREMHEKYGIKVHLNIFYETPKNGGFNLTQMTDKFKDEWRRNADWLHLSFHANSEYPDRPYIATSYGTMRRDHDKVIAEIRRFAGEEVLLPETTVHWGESTREGIRALRAAGMRYFAGYLTLTESKTPSVSYYLTPDKIENADHYGIWKDHSEDVIYTKIDLVLNTRKPEEITKILEDAYATHPEKGFWEVMIHEQYFYPDYGHYLPDFKERLEAGFSFAKRHNLTPTFLTPVFAEEEGMRK